MPRPEGRRRGRVRLAAPRWALAPGAILLVAGGLGAQPAVSLDACWRLLPGGATALEVDLMVQRASLRWTPSADGLEAAWRVSVRLEREGRALVDTSWTRRDWRGADVAVGPAEKLPDQALLSAPAEPAGAGGGRLRLRVEDLAGGPAAEKSLRLSAPEAGAVMGGFTLGVAAPELAATEGPFRRGAWRFLPYADALYGSGLDTLHAVLDLRAEGDADSLELSLALLGERDNRLASLLPRPLSSFPRQEGDPRTVAVALPVGHLPSGAYYVEAELRRQGRELGRLRRGFWVHNPGVAGPAPEPEGDDFRDADAEELARQWEAAQVLAGHYEQEAWDRLDLAGRRAFLAEFWRGRDPDPGTLVNELRVNLLTRLEEARARWPDREGGPLSDRARVFVRHGPPDAVETDYGQLRARFDLQAAFDDTGTGAGHRDFELWIYNRLEGGAEFIFIDLRGFGTFDLVHSTKSGEYFDPQWARKLFP